MMRRRTSAILMTIVVAGFAFGLGGTVALLVRAPDYAWIVAGIFLASSIAMTHFIGEGYTTGAVMGFVVTMFAGGALALHVVLGLSAHVSLAVFGVFAVVLLVGIARTIIAAGSADYPYED